MSKEVVITKETTLEKQHPDRDEWVDDFLPYIINKHESLVGDSYKQFLDDEDDINLDNIVYSARNFIFRLYKYSSMINDHLNYLLCDAYVESVQTPLFSLAWDKYIRKENKNFDLATVVSDFATAILENDINNSFKLARDIPLMLDVNASLMDYDDFIKIYNKYLVVLDDYCKKYDPLDMELVN